MALRGGRLQILAAASTAGTLTSVLGERLVELRAWGRISAPMVQWLADGAMQDIQRAMETVPIVPGLPLPPPPFQDLKSFSEIGSKGMYPGNMRRDLMRHVPNSGKLPKPVLSLVPCFKSRNNGGVLDHTHVPVLHPHALFDALYHNFQPLFMRMIDGGVQSFWDQVSPDDPKIIGHPMLEKPGWRQRAVPIILHGDGVQFTQRGNSLMTIQWKFLQNVEWGWDSCFHIADFPKMCVAADTWDNLWKIIVNSINALFDGFHPELDESGGVWPPGTPEHVDAGKEIADGNFFGVVWLLTGDLEFMSNEIKVAHFSSLFPCMHCRANRRADLNFRDVSAGAPWKATVCIPGPTDTPPSRHPVYTIRGLTRFHSPGDDMHSNDLGVSLWLHGSAMQDLLLDGRLARPTRDGSVAELWRLLQTSYDQVGTTCRLQNLTSKMIASGRANKFPYLKVKAAESRHLVKAMLHLLIRLDNGTEYDAHRIMAYQYLDTFNDIVVDSGLFLSEPDGRLIAESADAFLLHYNWLASRNHDLDVQLYNFTIKFHVFWHIAHFAKWLNPKVAWCYTFEDYIGKVQRCGQSCTAGTPKHLVPRKIMANLMEVLDIRLVRQLRAIP